MVRIFGTKQDKANAQAAKDDVNNKASESRRMREVRAEDTPEAKKAPSAKKRAAKRQFKKADKKNEPETETRNPDEAAAIKDATKARDKAERDRKAAKAKAMAPSSPEEVAAAASRLAVTGF